MPAISLIKECECEMAKECDLTMKLWEGFELVPEFKKTLDI